MTRTMTVADDSDNNHSVQDMLRRDMHVGDKVNVQR